MAADFLATTRSMSDERRWTTAVALALGLVLLAAWSAWLVLVEVPVRVVSKTARIEIDQIAHPLAAPLAGRVVTVLARQDDLVQRGQALVELDSQAQRLELAEAQARLAAQRAELVAVEDQLDIERHALEIERESASAAAAEVKARLRQASIASTHARRKTQQLERLSANGFVADNERFDAEALAEQSAAATDAARQSVHGVAAQKQLSVAQRRSGIEALERQATVLAGQVATSEAAVLRLRHEIDRRTIRAPIDGDIVEFAAVTPGAMVQQGDRIGVVLPAGTLRATAELEPSDALGRVHEGQLAQLRLDGFPWAQHGVVEATIRRVAGEVRDGSIHIELDIDVPSATIPLQHGLPGIVEIELERVSPATLVLRAAGKALAEPVRSVGQALSGSGARP